MFIPKIYEPVKNTVAFDKNQLETANYPSYMYGQTQNAVMFRIPAIWFSHSPGTQGSLVSGYLRAFFPERVDTNGKLVKDYTYQDFLDNTREDRGNGFLLQWDSEVVLSDEKLWTDAGADTLLKTETAIKYWRNLPDIPEGWDGWFKLSNRR